MGGGSHLEIITQCLGSSACIIYQSHWKRIVPLWTSFHRALGLSSSLSVFVLILSASVALLPHFHSNSAQQDKTTVSLNTNHPGPGPAQHSEGLAPKPAPGLHHSPRPSHHTGSVGPREDHVGQTKFKILPQLQCRAEPVSGARPAPAPAPVPAPAPAPVPAMLSCLEW